MYRSTGSDSSTQRDRKPLMKQPNNGKPEPNAARSERNSAKENATFGINPAGRKRSGHEATSAAAQHLATFVTLGQIIAGRRCDTTTTEAFNQLSQLIDQDWYERTGDTPSLECMLERIPQPARRWTTQLAAGTEMSIQLEAKQLLRGQAVQNRAYIAPTCIVGDSAERSRTYPDAEPIAAELTAHIDAMCLEAEEGANGENAHGRWWRLPEWIIRHDRGKAFKHHRGNQTMTLRINATGIECNERSTGYGSTRPSYAVLTRLPQLAAKTRVTC